MAKHSDDLYGSDPRGKAESISSKFLSNPKPTLDVHGEKDDRFTKGNESGGKKK